MALLAGCAGAPAESFDLSDCAQPDATDLVTVEAEDLKFNVPCIAAPAGRAFKLHFSSLDGADHNVAIYESAAKASEHFKGELISSGESIDYPIAALAAGEYYFDCTIHPDMNGPLFAVASD